ncbi:heterokaryon incompatibility protein HET-C [Coprinopsis cinerea okayama7|uniref:Heterokaryon incompatibility protein HET-C n=1 Tax=Coprinopsis cinerea (strain Okayama-7 / 130 / ATCC MYA-4618 / FGSC 9003) TaxID=240176 RepID=A8N355_COPC7|nr:heterokaryon incompatibility protein HET-C [Coprinopsis cinerea okayama7\|eukprot:XP_001829300.1 heterokaryon incompatibility protein HET-C [Coprinopsis cinerea okayama7\
MAFTPSLTTTFLIVATVCILLPRAHAFGAGDIPDFAYLNDKAFRHGDIESVLENLAKTAGRAAIGGGNLLAFASSVVSAATGPRKFNKNDIKKVYFGNWLRDYSQCMDIAGLSKLSAETLVLVVSVLGFMTFGFSTEEFEVTAERLGVYLPVEHIDNPKGYAEKEGDAREYHPKLRPPVDPRELEIDPETGMKNYMATEGQGWDTSTGFIRRTLRECIEYGRRANGEENADLWEAYRLLGTGLHTLEDLMAHSNWCELALRKMGYEEVFCHVGDNVLVDTPNGPAPPLVTGTFGGADFLHSLLGEAGDKLSQASVTDLSGKLNEAQQSGGADLGPLKNILSRIMGGSSEEEEKLNQGEEMKEAAQGYHFDPDNIAPPEVQQKLLDLLKWHDDVMRNVTKKMAMVPGLNNLLEEFSNALNGYIYTVLAPYLTPILAQATSVLDEGSKAVIDSEDQYEVFDNPDAHDPSHSLLSKDHFGLILNEPAGKIAQIIVEHTVNHIVQAWYNDEDPDSVLNVILEAFHHPYYNTGNSEVQHKMFEHMQKWIGGLGPDEAAQTIEALTKESVREHKNKRLGSEGHSFDEPGYGGCSHSYKPSGGYSSGGTNKPSYKTGVGAAAGAGAAASYYSGGRQDTTGSGGRKNEGGYGRQDNTGYGGRQDNTGYGGRQGTTYGRQDTSYGRQETTGYGRQDTGYGRQETAGHGGRQDTTVYGRQDNTGYGGRQDTSYGGRQDNTSYGRQDQTSSYGGRQEAGGYGGGYGGRQGQGSSHGGRQETVQSTYSGGYGRQDTSGYSGRQEYSGGYQKDEGYGGRRRDDDYGKPKYGGGYGGRRDDDDKPKYGSGGYGGRRDDDDNNKPKYGGGGYGGHRRDDEEDRHKYGGGGYGGQRRDGDDKPKYGGGFSSQRRDDDDKPKYGGGYGQRRDDDDDRPKYGGGYGGGGYGGQRRDDSDDDRRGKSKHKRDDSDDKPKYGGQYGNQGGHRRDDSDDRPKYGGSHRRNDSDEKPKKYKDDSDDEKKKKKYRRKSKDDDSDDDRKEKKGYQPSYGQPSYGSGYAPSYGGSNETFGAERMRISHDSDDEDSRKYKYGGGRRY